MPDTCDLQPAPVGLFRRLGAIVYDFLLLIAVLLVASLIVIIPFGITPGHPLYPLYECYIYGLSFLFYGWFWTHGGQTLGMRAWRMRVQDQHGGTITWGQSGLRFAAAIVSWVPLGAGYLWCLLNRERLTWHDMISGTRLVRVHSPASIDLADAGQGDGRKHQHRQGRAQQGR